MSDFEAEPDVGQTFTGAADLLGKPPIIIDIDGNAEIIRDQAALETH